MIWFTWRQHRAEAIIGGVLLLLIVSFTVITGLVIRTLYDQVSIAKCIRPSEQCAQAFADFNQQVMVKAFGGSTFFNLFITLLLALPLLVGVFLGAPAGARELEQGTYRLVWTQGIPWYRWFTVKFGLLAVSTLCVFTLLSLLLSWWSAPLSIFSGQNIWSFYDMRAVFPAYALFAFVLGFTSGILTRRTVPAMAIALVVFILLRIGIELFWRPTFLPPLSHVFSVTTRNFETPVQSWTITPGEMIDRHGNIVRDSGTASCENAGQQYEQCLDTHGFRFRAVYQPEDRFWLFQGFESCIYFLLSVCLTVLAYWWIKRKII